MLRKSWRQTRWAIWSGRGFWAITDQALFALSNFALNILLARWLVPEDYGAFVIAYTIFLLLGALHTGIFTEPMLVFGSGKHKDRFGHYLYVLVKGHIAFGLFGSLLFAIVALSLWYFTSSPLTSAIGGLAFALPFILLQWLLRRACYILMTPALAARAGVLYMALMLAGLWGLSHIDRIGSATALIVMGLANLLSGLWLLQKLRAHRAPNDSDGLQRSAMEDHWRYGRWAMTTGLLSWVPGNVVFLLLPIWHGLEATAVLRALNNLIMPALQITIALFALLLPVLVRARNSEQDRMMRIGRKAALIFTAGTFSYWMLIGFFAEPVMTLLYGSQYTDYASILWILGLLPVVTVWVGAATALLRALERPDLILRAHAIATIISLAASISVIWLFGLIGAISALIMAVMLKAVWLWFSVSLESNNHRLATHS